MSVVRYNMFQSSLPLQSLIASIFQWSYWTWTETLLVNLSRNNVLYHEGELVSILGSVYPALRSQLGDNVFNFHQLSCFPGRMPPVTAPPTQTNLSILSSRMQLLYLPINVLASFLYPTSLVLHLTFSAELFHSFSSHIAPSPSPSLFAISALTS